MFYKDIRRKDGVSSFCRRCHNDITIATKKKNPKKYLAYMRKYAKTYIAPYKEKNPNWSIARNKLVRALKSGKIKKEPSSPTLLESLSRLPYVPDIASVRILGNLLMVFRRELENKDE